MNKQYLVAYITNVENLNYETESLEDGFQVFVDYDNNKLAAQILYERLLLDENTYSASLCEILDSTDY